MFHDDWLVRQIQATTQAIANKMLNKESTPTYEIRNKANQTETDLLDILLNGLLAENHINEAENLLFDMLNPNNHNHLIVATDFYSHLSNMSDEELEAANFSREEIESGLNEIKTSFGIAT